jgi:creatinine amidohydrolase
MVKLFDLPHTRARALLATGCPVYLAVNPVEYHGPHLSLHNDSVVSRGLARDLHAALGLGGEVVWADDLEIGVDPCPGPGTRYTSFTQARALVVEACKRLAEIGAQKVVIMTFHGSPLHNLAIDAGVRWLASHGVRAVAPFHRVLEAMLDVQGDDVAAAYETVSDPDERRDMMKDVALDFHAGFFETSVSLHYAPETVDAVYKQLPPSPRIVPDARVLKLSRAAERVGLQKLSRELWLVAHGIGWYALRPFPGYSGRPARASAVAGAVFAKHLVGALVEATEPALAGGRAQAPVLSWLAQATVGGRFGRLEVPLDAVAT